MICNICGTKEATIHLTEIINGQMAEIHICESCAEEKGTDFKTYFSFGDVLTGMVGLEKDGEGLAKEQAITCKSCGMEYEEFVKTGRLGCANCYESFDKLLANLIRRVQRGTYHVGKKPSRISRDTRSVHDLRLLQEKLRRSIQQEAFEEAAHLRDEIKQMEEKLRKGKKSKT